MAFTAVMAVTIACQKDHISRKAIETVVRPAPADPGRKTQDQGHRTQDAGLRTRETERGNRDVGLGGGPGKDDISRKAIETVVRPAPADQGRRIQDSGPGRRDTGCQDQGRQDQGRRTQDPGPRTQDSGPRAQDSGLRAQGQENLERGGRRKGLKGKPGRG